MRVLTLLFRMQIMLVCGDRDLSETLFTIWCTAHAIPPSSTWALGAGFLYEAAQALFDIALDRSACTRILTNRIFFTFADKP